MKESMEPKARPGDLEGSVEKAEKMNKLFNNLIGLSMLQIDKIDRHQAELLQKNKIGELLGAQIVIRKSSDPSPDEADSVRASIVEALVLAGDLANAEKVANDISLDGYDDALFAQQSIIRGWARKDPKHALELASTTPKTATDEYVDEDEQEEQREHAKFIVFETIAETSKPDEVRKLADRIIQQSDDNYDQNVARVIRVKATAAMGNIDEARKMAEEEEVPMNQIPDCLAVYKYSHAVEDIQAARAVAEKYAFEPYEQWLKIAEATREPQDIARARAEIEAITIEEIEKGWIANFGRNNNLLKLAKISGDPSDIAIAREGILANPQSADSLFMELCRITRDRNDFALLLQSTKGKDKNKTDFFSTLACIAEITKEEVDFLAAAKAAMEIDDPTKGVSAAYLRGLSLAELAQVIYGKSIHR